MEVGQAVAVPVLFDGFFDCPVSYLEFAKFGRAGHAGIEVAHLVVGVYREQVAGLGIPGLDLKLHVRISVITQAEGVDGRMGGVGHEDGLEGPFRQQAGNSLGDGPVEPAKDGLRGLTVGVGVVQVDIDGPPQILEAQAA